MISLFFRKKREGVNSIETVFSSIEPYLLPHKIISLPYEGASLLVLVRNILFAHKQKSKINHISGDCHYIALGLGRNTLLTIHDVHSATNCTNPFKRIYILLFWFWLPALIVRRISVISEFTKKELSELIPFAKRKIFVIHNAFNTKIKFTSLNANEIPVVLHMGTKSNKNLERVIDALKDIDCKLTIVGKLNDSQIALLKRAAINFENHYDVSYEEIAEFYHKCDVVSFPSTYEGFGVPILEANAAGRPIIAGDIPVLHEVAGDAACFVNPFDVNSIRDGFLKILSNNEFRETLIKAGLENINRFSPETITEKYNDIYRTLQ